MTRQKLNFCRKEVSLFFFSPKIKKKKKKGQVLKQTEGEKNGAITVIRG